MVSFSHLFTLLCVLVAVSRADDAASPKSEVVEEKWFFGNRYGLSSCFGTGFGLWGGYSPLYRGWAGMYNLNYLYGYQGFAYSPLLFVKATEGAQSVSRRAIALEDVEQLSRRSDTESVACATHGKAPQTFSVKNCLAAAQQLAEKKVSTATHGNCQLSLVHGTEKVAPGSITVKQLEAGVHNMLQACSKSADEKEAPAKGAAKIDDKQAFMILSSPQ
ncbi:hypothetical protein PTTG_10405 [Puccinia triticina 1-1 BBBD Race 1]|uniref:Uncharacterized protein n=2 Tax=Puccinia triticina TaxID=208348 RepID=A0A0C4FB12_PUCT1|nr:uncharacterized protein PtA15_4A535 [Puccinia triticina]OAV85607.1 hypothetical protein PTTG_10405 [Puccinia triticina 1-1 BBBD Race 1]WAQ84084.1 hypothetical protein PtA15_4A535 [Puccinia triticina]